MYKIRAKLKDRLGQKLVVSYRKNVEYQEEKEAKLKNKFEASLSLREAGPRSIKSIGK